MNSKLKNNIFYIEGKGCGSFYDIEDFVLNMMIMYDQGLIFDSYLHFVKKIKDLTGLGLYYIKSYSDLIRDLGFIVKNDENKTIIRNGILYIRSYKDIINMIDYNINYNQFMRLHKIKKLQQVSKC
jgi:hypothetical protein